PYRDLEDAARELEDALKAVDGVRTTDAWAYPARELRVQLDPARMQRLNVTPQAVAQALQAANSSIPAGVIDLGSRSFSVQTGGGFDSIESVRGTVVRTAGGPAERVGGVAEAARARARHTRLGRVPGARGA